MAGRPRDEAEKTTARQRAATADLIRSLAEVEARQRHLAIGCSSMFSYCTEVLHLSEHAAYARIAAARAATQFPVVISFADGGPTTVDNLELRCPAHNAHEAERWFGPLVVRETGGAWGELGLDQVRWPALGPERFVRTWKEGTGSNSHARLAAP